MKSAVTYFAAAAIAVSSISLGQSSMTQPSTVPVEAGPTTDAATQPATSPSTLPATSPSATTAPSVPRNGAAASSSNPKGLPPAYGIFTTRSLFMKGHVPPPGSNNTAPPQPAPPSNSSSRTLQNIVFDGATNADGEIVAMFEDTVAGKIIQAKAGDAVAGGKITAVSLDSVTYESAGRTTRVMIGQTLDASETPLLTSRGTITDTGSGPTTAPVVGNVNDMLEQLRAKRRKELGQ